MLHEERSCGRWKDLVPLSHPENIAIVLRDEADGFRLRRARDAGITCGQPGPAAINVYLDQFRSQRPEKSPGLRGFEPEPLGKILMRGGTASPIASSSASA